MAGTGGDGARDKNELLDELFAVWPGADREEFHRDGIIDEAAFRAAPRRVLFVMAEPLSLGAGSAHLQGCDLRGLYAENTSRKEATHNVALWTEALLDGRTRYGRLACEAVRAALRRIALLNLKKLGGNGSGNYALVRQHAARDRGLLQKQIAIIDPEVIVSCGKPVSQLLAGLAPEALRGRTIEANNPELRPQDAPEAFLRVAAQAAPLLIARK